MKTVLAIVGLLWVVKKFGTAHQAAAQMTELYPADPYAGYNGATQWDVLNGANWSAPAGPNAHQPGFFVGINREPETANPCVCK